MAAPYGYPWYLLNLPARLGFLPWILYLFTIDSLASYLVVRYRGWMTIVPFMLSSQFFLNYDSVDFFPFILSFAGAVSPWFSLFALLVKLPLGAPGYVWDFVLHSPASISYGLNWPRYGLLGAWWLAGIGLYVKRWRKKRGSQLVLPVKT